MYSALWRLLPGGVALKVLQLILIAGLLVFALFEWVFPWVAQTFLVEDSTVD
jgi:lipopolysaccharide export LptBFGC system permease protein LptF